MRDVHALMWRSRDGSSGGVVRVFADPNDAVDLRNLLKAQDVGRAYWIEATKLVGTPPSQPADEGQKGDEG